MKFKYYLETISGIEIYPLISLFIFVLFFIGLTILIIRMDKKYISEMSLMPLEDKPKTDNDSFT
jgi:cytochrome c oxidase cbb3-type subunit 3